MTQIRNRNFMSASRTIEVSQPSELEYVKRNTVNHSFRKIKKKISESMDMYNVNFERHKQKFNTKHKFKYR